MQSAVTVSTRARSSGHAPAVAGTGAEDLVVTRAPQSWTLSHWQDQCRQPLAVQSRRVRELSCVRAPR